MTKPLASLIGALAASTALACAGSVLAEPASAELGAGFTSADAPLGSPVELRVDLRGQVASRCEFTSPLTGFNGLDMSRPGQAVAGFGIDCNTPFVLRVRSQHGGFASDSSLIGVERIAAYDVKVQLGTDQGRRDLGWCDAASVADDATATCAFGASAADGGWSSGEAVAIDQTGTVQLRWDDAVEGQARVGAYNDTIVIELEVRS